MVFNSPAFLAFVSVSAAAYAVTPASMRRSCLLVISLVACSYSSIGHLGVLLLVAAIAHAGALLVSRNRRALWPCVATLLVPMCVFKYVPSFGNVVWSLFSTDYVPGPIALALPLGISFYSLQAVSYVVDVHRGVAAPCSRYRDVALSLAFFPKLSAGPIERTNHLVPQLSRFRGASSVDVHIGLKYLLWGYFCKVVVADGTGALVDGVLHRVREASGLTLAVTFCLYSFQIYFDFLGYSNIAIGIGRLFGIKLVRNFRRPYGSSSLRQFWRRWHITLSYWFRDYLYIPLGGRETGGVRRAALIVFVFVVSGLWHGTGVTFLLWGGYHGLAYMCEELLRGRGRQFARTFHFPASRMPRIVLTFSIVSLGWVLFRMNTPAEAGLVFGRLFGLDTAVDFWTIQPVLWERNTLVVLALLMAGLVVDGLPFCRAIIQLTSTDRAFILQELITVDALVVGLLLFGGQASRDFIYFRF